MPDRGAYWEPVPDWSRARIEARSVTIAAGEAAVPLWIVSGTPSPNARGPRDVVDPADYTLRLAPDQFLVASSAAKPEGFTSEVTDGYIIFDITGADATDLMCRTSGYDFASTESYPQESARMVCANQKVIVTRIANGWRIHVERPLAPALWLWLSTILKGGSA